MMSSSLPERTENHDLVVSELRAFLSKWNESKGSVVNSRELEQLKQNNRPEYIADVLTPFLFLSSSKNEEQGLSSDEALMLLIHLVSTDSATFLKASSRSVRRTAVRLFSGEGPSDPRLAVSPALLSTVISQIVGVDVEVATNAAETILVLCRRLGLDLARRVVGDMVLSWKQLAQNTDHQHRRNVASTLSVRCASLLVDLILALDQSAMTKLAQEMDALDLLQKMLQDKSDPLMQMSIFDFIEKLAHADHISPELSHWLCSDSVLDPLLEMAGGATEENEENQPDSFLGAPALRILSYLVCHLVGGPDSMDVDSDDNNPRDKVWTGFFRALSKFRGNNNPIERLAVVDAISSLAMASTNTLAHILNHSDDSDIYKTIRYQWLSLSVAQPELQSAILFSVARVLRYSYPLPSLEESHVLKRQLYITLASVNGTKTENNRDTTDWIVSLARSPFPEVRLGAYAILSALASQIPTGAQILLQNTEFFNLVLGKDHIGDATKEGREALYEVVRAIYESDAKRLLADSIVQKLELLVRRGPHFAPTQIRELNTE